MIVLVIMYVMTLLMCGSNIVIINCRKWKVMKALMDA